jgi:hypothetical protein
MKEYPLNQEIVRLFPPFLMSDGNSFAVGHEGYNICEGFSLNRNIMSSLLVRNINQLIDQIYTIDMQCFNKTTK